MHKSSGQDDKRLQNTLKRLGVNTIPGIEEVNIFKDDTVVHFTNPKVQASIAANTYVISGPSQTKSASPNAAKRSRQPWGARCCSPPAPAARWLAGSFALSDAAWLRRSAPRQSCRTCCPASCRSWARTACRT